MGWIENRSDGWELNSRVQCPPWAATHRPRDRIPVRTRTPLSHRTSTPCVYLYLYTSPRAANRPCDGRHQKREYDTNFFVCLLVRRYRIDALALPLVSSHHTAVQGPFSAMRNEYSGKYTPRPPPCPSCAQLMRLARTTSRFGNLPELYIFECRACGVSHIDAAWEQVA